MMLAHPAAALEANKSNLWYGGDEGIEVVWKTGKNLAYMIADRAYLNRMLVGDVYITGEMTNAIAQGAPKGMVAMMAAIDSGDIKVEGGTKQDVQKFFSYFDKPVDVGSINLIVR
jgi:hypothetical protein